MSFLNVSDEMVVIDAFMRNGKLHIVFEEDRIVMILNKDASKKISIAYREVK